MKVLFSTFTIESVNKIGIYFQFRKSHYNNCHYSSVIFITHYLSTFIKVSLCQHFEFQFDTEIEDFLRLRRVFDGNANAHQLKRNF